MLVAQVGKHHAVLWILTFVEIKRSQVNPCGTAHLLVDEELCRDTFVPDGVTGIVYTAFDGLVTDIDSISACFRNLRLPGGKALLAIVGRGFDLSGCSCKERILLIQIGPWVECKTCGIGLGP